MSVVEWSALAVEDRSRIELVVRHTHYVMAYRVMANKVRILRVLHSAQQWPDVFTDAPGNGR